jgi:predicted MFS family arabinose efflux permease
MKVLVNARRPLPGLPEQRSTRVAYFIVGFGISSWAPLVPYAKDRLDLNTGGLGLLLLCVGIGSIVTMPLSGALAGRLGCRRVIWGAGMLIAASLPFLATVTNIAFLACTLLAFGAGFGAMGVAVNLQAVIVEQAGRRALMSGFHALFSVGGIIGSGGMSGLLWAGLSPLAATLCTATVIAGLLLAFGGKLLPYGGEEGAPLFALPRGKILFIGILCFIVFLAEGAMLDWSAVLLTSLQGMPRSRAGLGYAVFAFAMAVGRLSGDRIVRAFGGRSVLAIGGSCAASGLALAVLAPSRPGALVGFGMVGLGSSNIVPVLYSALGRQTVMAPNLAVAAVTTLGFTGILTGPALIGFVAHMADLPAAFLGVAAMLMVVAASARTASS